MRSLIFILLIISVLAKSHNIFKRQANESVEEESYNWEAGVPHYEHVQYTSDGEIDFIPRIIGGTPAVHGDFPAKISIQTIAGNHFCGGALIDLRHVLTAAHCLTSDFGAVFEPETIRLLGDDISIQRIGSPTRQIRLASHIFVHPNYNVRTYAADLAVVRLTVAFTQTNTLRPLARSLQTPRDDLNCNLAGWGTTSETNNRPHPILLRVQLPTVNMVTCNATSSFNGNVPIGSLCAGFFDGSRDACFGDSGGALICSGQIAGIVSFGFGCARRNFPGVYVDVSQFNHWIQDCMSSTLSHDEVPRPEVSPNPNSVAKLFVSGKLIIVLTIFVNIFTN